MLLESVFTKPGGPRFWSAQLPPQKRLLESVKALWVNRRQSYAIKVQKSSPRKAKYCPRRFHTRNSPEAESRGSRTQRKSSFQGALIRPEMPPIPAAPPRGKPHWEESRRREFSWETKNYPALAGQCFTVTVKGQEGLSSRGSSPPPPTPRGPG